ncbi:MAG: hypothetical protein SGARI_000539, partial [Bacillariaceae sp.]
MSDTSVCDAYKAATIQCVAMDMTGSCMECIDMETLAEDFPTQLKSLFASTQAFAIPGTDQFCTVAQDRVCGEVKNNYSCCCQEQIAEWQGCLVEQVYSKDLSLGTPCTSNCNGGGGSGGGGSSMGIIIGVVAAVVVLGGGLAWWFCRRRRMRAAAMTGDDLDASSKDIRESDKTKESGEDSGKDHRTLDDMEEGHLSDSSEDKSAPPPAVISTMPIKGDDASSVNDMSEFSRPKPKREPSARDKKKAIEQWHSMKKQGSNRSLEEVLSEQGSGDEDERPKRRSSKTRSSSRDRSSSRERLDRSSSGRNLPKKISSRDLNNILKENVENSEKLKDVEAERDEVEKQLYKAEDEAEKLRIEQEETLRRLAELEAQNKVLKKEVRSRSKSRDRDSKSVSS